MNHFAWSALWSFRLTRMIGYTAGFLLFYAPFELFARAVDLLIPPSCTASMSRVSVFLCICS